MIVCNKASNLHSFIIETLKTIATLSGLHTSFPNFEIDMFLSFIVYPTLCRLPEARTILD